MFVGVDLISVFFFSFSTYAQCSSPGIEFVPVLVVTRPEKAQLQSGDKSRCALFVGFVLNGWVDKAWDVVMWDVGVPGLWVLFGLF